MMLKSKLVVLFLFVATLLSAQEVLSPLLSNPVLRSGSNSQMQSNAKVLADLDTISLPFIDDFSELSSFPNPNRWLDDYVYVNRSMAIAPPSVGVATFDGLNNIGYPYNFNVQPSSSGPADVLTSKRLRLGGLQASDSVYLSFYYQPQGHGNAPNPKDTFLLEFKRVSTGTWEHIWSVEGYSLGSDTDFVQMIVPVLDTAFLKDGFQFRFRNYATLSGNVDHWNLDYVYLNKNRTQNDSITDDVGFVYNSPSLLKEFTAMPWDHYVNGVKKNNLQLFIRNNYYITKKVIESSQVLNAKSLNSVCSYNGGEGNVDVYKGFGYCNEVQVTQPALNCDFTSLTDTTSFIVQHIIAPKVGTDFIPANDTLTAYQKFYNYYAYDDGTAEQGYGINQTFSYVAYQFNLTKADTLRAVDMCFTPMVYNYSVGSSLASSFRLTVWDDAGGEPGNILYQDSLRYPIYESGYHAFHTYPVFKDKFVVGPGNVYIGWYQLDDKVLNIGMDMNNNTKDHIFYNVTGTWNTSGYPGALMIRPILGRKVSLVGVNELAQRSTSIEVFPNPSTDMFYVRFSEKNTAAKIDVTDIQGKLIVSKNSLSDTDIESFSTNDIEPGMYFVTVTPNAGAPISTKLIITK